MGSVDLIIVLAFRINSSQVPIGTSNKMRKTVRNEWKLGGVDTWGFMMAKFLAFKISTH